MAQRKAVLVTGVGNDWGAKVAGKMIAEGKYQVIGLDDRKPEIEIKDLDFIQADIRNPLLADLIKSEQIDTVCHLVFQESTRPNEADFDLNVLGTIKVLGACVEAGVRKIVLKSSTTVYGARVSNPGFLTEEHPLRGSRRYGYIRDRVEIEAFCNGFRRQHPGVVLTVLRFAEAIGPYADTPMTRFLSDPLAPVLLGFDPMLQIIHEKDLVDALVHVIVEDHPGVYNIAAEGFLPLSRILGITGKIPIPVVHLFAYWGLSVIGTTTQRYMPIEPDYLRYRWVADLSRMHNELGFMPNYTAEEALREFAGELRTKSYLREATTPMGYDEERLRDTIERRRRAMEASAPVVAQAVRSNKGKKS